MKVKLFLEIRAGQILTEKKASRAHDYYKISFKAEKQC